MSLIMNVIGPELSELFTLEFAKIAESDCLYPSIYKSRPISTNHSHILRTKSVTKKETNKCMAEIYDPGGTRTRAARLISQYHNH